MIVKPSPSGGSLILAYIFLHLHAPYTHPTIKKGLHQKCNPLILLVRPAGFEPAAYGFEVLKTGHRGIIRDMQGHNNFSRLK